MSIQVARQELDSLTEFQKGIHVTNNVSEELISTFYKAFIKSTWHSCLPMKLKCTSDGEETVYSVNTSFHYLCESYLKFNLPAIRVKPEYKGRVRICWPHNIGTNITLQASFKEDDDVYQTWDNVWADYYFQYYQASGAGKREAHNVGMGNVKCLEDWSEYLPAYSINADQPWFYSFGGDPAFSFPIYAKGSETRAEHRYTFRRKVTDLLRVQILDKNLKWKDISRTKGVSKYLENHPAMIKTPELWGRFVYNSDQELKFYKCQGERSIYIRDVEVCDSPNPTKYKSISEIDLHSTNPCLAIFWAAENRDAVLNHNFSNYTTDTNDIYSGWDPIKTTTLKYGTVKRLDEMTSDHFNITEARRHFPSAPSERGYQAYSFAWESTNFHGDVGIVFDGLNAKLQCRIDNNNIFADNHQEEEEKEETDDGDDYISVSTVEGIAPVEEEPSPDFVTRVRLLVVRKFTISHNEDEDKYSFKIQ